MSTAPPAPLVRLVVATSLVTSTPHVHQRLHHLSHHRLLLSPSRVSRLTDFCIPSRHVDAFRPMGCCFTSHHANTSCPPAPPSLFAPPPLIEPLSCLSSDWFLNRLLSYRCLPSTGGASASFHAIASCCAVLVPDWGFPHDGGYQDQHCCCIGDDATGVTNDGTPRRERRRN